MEALFRKLPWLVLVQAVLVGAAIGVLAFAGGGLFLSDADGLLAAAVGLVVTLFVALAIGIWAGAPEAASLHKQLRRRWFAAGITTGVAGAAATVFGLNNALVAGVAGRTAALLLLVAAPAYAVGLLLPTLLAWAEEHVGFDDPEEEAGSDAPGPLGVVVLGGLAGVAFGALTAGLLLEPLMSPGPLLLATAAALIVPTLLPESGTHESEERVLYDVDGPISLIRVTELVFPGQRQPEHRLYLNGEEESGELARSGAPTLPYIAAAEHWLAEAAARGMSYLFLGGGAYTLPRRVAERDPRAQITVVELDPEVTRVAGRFFGLRPEPPTPSGHGAARAVDPRWARDDGAGLDRIFVDVYSGDEALPYSLVTREAFTSLRGCLQPGGWLLLNAIGVPCGAGQGRFWSIVRTLTDVFPTVALYTHLGPDYPERQNLLLAASAEPDARPPDRAGLFDRWPRDEWPAWNHRTAVLRDVFDERGTAATGAARVEGADRAANPA